MIDHVGFEVSDLARAARFYDAVFHAIGGRRTFESPHAIAYGMNGHELWIVVRGRPPGPGYGHIALAARGRKAVEAAHAAGVANGGTDDGPPGLRPDYGEAYFAAYLRDPDGLALEIVSR